MKVIVDIPNSLYANLRIITHGSPASKRLLECMKEGMPLPKCHGDLVDKGDIIHDIDCDEEMRLGKNVEWVREVIRNAPTIIKASEEGAVG